MGEKPPHFGEDFDLIVGTLKSARSMAERIPGAKGSRKCLPGLFT